MLSLFYLIIAKFLILLVFSIDSSSSYNFFNSIPIPDSTSLGSQTCKQMEVTSTRIFCLCQSNAIRSWYKNGSGFIQNKLMQVSPWTQKIIQFQITTDETQLVFYERKSKNIYTLSAFDLSLKNMFAANIKYNLTGAIKTKDKFVIFYQPNNSTKNNRCAYIYFNNLNLLIDAWPTSFSAFLNMKLKLNANQNIIISWNNSFFIHIWSIYNTTRINTVEFYYLTIIYERTSLITTISEPIISQDGSRMVMEFDNLQNLAVYNSTNSHVSLRCRQIANISVPYLIQKVQFINRNSIIAVYHDTIITYFYADTLQQIISVDYGLRFVLLFVLQFVDNSFYSCNNNTLNIYNLTCPETYQNLNNSYFICRKNQNITVLNQTQQFDSNLTSTSILTSVQFFLNMQSYSLQNQGFKTLNKIPGSRLLFKPIFIFFSNFDDLWLYNYINTTYNPILQNLFDSIQSTQQQKWGLINFQTIWSDQIGFNIKQIENYFNNSNRIKYTSNKFLSIESNANGYILNTLQFFLSNFILITLIFITGNQLYRIFHCLKLRIQSIFTQFRFLLAFMLFCLEGNIQYMAYLMGFEFDNIWYLKFNNKIHECILFIWFFIFIFIVSTIYFFLKYLYKEEASQFYNNCTSDIRGVLYSKIINGIRNILLGLVHYLLSQNGSLVYIKFICLISIEMTFLGLIIYLIRANFFIQKTRQWITLFIGILRMVLVLIFILDVLLNQKDDRNVQIFSNGYGFLLSVYINLWLISIVYEFGRLFWQLKVYLWQSDKGQARFMKKKSKILLFPGRKISTVKNIKIDPKQSEENIFNPIQSAIYLVSKIQHVQQNKQKQQDKQIKQYDKIEEPNTRNLFRIQIMKRQQVSIQQKQRPNYMFRK